MNGESVERRNNPNNFSNTGFFEFLYFQEVKYLGAQKCGIVIEWSNASRSESSRCEFRHQCWGDLSMPIFMGCREVVANL